MARLLNDGMRTVLRDRYFRRVVLSRLISNIGNGMTPIALAFGVLALPGATPTSLSIVLAAGTIPVVLLLPIGGVVADRLGKPRVIGTCDLIVSIIVMTTGVLLITGHATVLNLAILAAITGALHSFWWPAYPGLVPDVVDEDNLQPANALMSTASNAGLIIGSAIGGILVATIGSGWAIAIDAVTFLIAGFLVFSLRHLSRPHDSGESMLGDLAHGWRVFTSYRWVVAVVAAFSFIVMVWRGAEDVLGPVAARENYAGPTSWAFVLGAQAAGLLIGAIISTRLRVRRPMIVGMIAMVSLPLFLVLLALAAPLWMVVGAALVFGACLEIFGVLWFTALQTHVPHEAIARVSAYDAFGSLLLGPVGLALAGPLLLVLSLSQAFWLCAAIAAAAILGGLIPPSVRHLRAEPLPS